MTTRLAYALLSAYLVLFTICAINPYGRSVWWAENIPIILLVGVIILAHRHHRFSVTSFIFMSFLIVLHTIGGHYTFERVPFGLITDTFGFERNHYDRVAHFTVGFYAYPIAEVLLRKRLVQSGLVLVMFGVFSIVTVAAGYEIFEWIYAIHADSGAGAAVLGSQGDVWDAQKDMLADTLGSMLAVMVFVYLHRGEIAAIKLRKV